VTSARRGEEKKTEEKRRVEKGRKIFDRIS
jgi:hypothetical protein